MINVAINGFGRIGRMVARALIERQEKNVRVVAINDLGPLETNKHLLQWDSVHGPLKAEISSGEGWMDFGFGKTRILAETNPSQLPWGELGVDIVLECSGIFTSGPKAQVHLDAGAKKVLISAPADAVDATVVYGVNHHTITPQHRIVSNASCTTNCLAPVASVIHGGIGIESGYMTTIHAFTGDQNIHDRTHRDLARARAATQSLIPSTTGAAKALGLVLPELNGKLDGTAIRVPTPNVSLIDFVMNTSRSTSVEEINSLMQEAAQGALKGVLAINALPLVSIDFNHHPASSIFDVNQTQMVGDKLARVLAWYDNEWGFSHRMIDMLQVLVSKG